MSDSTLTFRVDETLKNAFAEVARAQDRNAAQLLRDYMRTAVREAREKPQHGAWFQQEVAVGRRAAAQGERRSNEDVEREFAHLRASVGEP
ncbi:MAG TPA: hypothetical protein VM687_09405 [Stenotrophomonas sp.]|nr:hypothetical protein [Stenotrophomonas sp.]